MRNERGFAFIPFLLANWQAVSTAVAIVGLALMVFGYYKICENDKVQHKKLVATLQAQAEAQEEKFKLAVEQGRKDKEKADNENARLRQSNTALARSLRNARASTSYVPPAAPGASRPERAAFDRAELERAIQRLDEGVSGIVAEGDQARIDLDTAKAWAQ